MKKFLFVLSLSFAGACGINEENRRSVQVNLKNGKEIKLLVFEKKAYVGEEKTLMVYANEHSLKTKDCDDREFKNFGDELFFETINQNDLPAIKSGRIHLAISQTSPDKPYCVYSYAKKDNGEWIGEK